jgi:dTDP-4-amino-4,6-dideoxygalactose transaminase
LTALGGTAAEPVSSAVQLQDLAAHHEPLLPDLAAAAVRVLTSGRFIAAAETEAFEREACAALSIPHAVGVSSGTDGLLAALMACGVGPGDEVVTTPFSFFASVGSIVRLGATPVFADIEPSTFNLDPAAAAARLGSKTRAVLVVHLFGRPARLDGLSAACAARDVPIIEDAAQAIGARAGGRPVGDLGRAAVISFFPSKNLGGFGDGGMVLTSDADFAARLRVLRVHGATAKHRHEVLGGNFRLDELQAALLRVKLPHLSQWTERRRQIADRYLQRLGALAATGAVDLPPADPDAVWNQFVIRARGNVRAPLRQHLATRGIATAVYYPTPLHLQPALAYLGLRPGDLPHAERAAAEALALPIYPELPLADVDRVAAAVAAFFG